jgi:hypothetical protein
MDLDTWMLKAVNAPGLISTKPWAVWWKRDQVHISMHSTIVCRTGIGEKTTGMGKLDDPH